MEKCMKCRAGGVFGENTYVLNMFEDYPALNWTCRVHFDIDTYLKLKVVAASYDDIDEMVKKKYKELTERAEKAEERLAGYLEVQEALEAKIEKVADRKPNITTSKNKGIVEVSDGMRAKMYNPKNGV